jgi:hypothetical protein
MKSIVQLNKEIKNISDNKAISDIMRRDYDARYNLLVDNLERTEISIAAIEGRYEKNYKIPLPIVNISPRQPKGIKVIVKPDEFSEMSQTLSLIIIIGFFIVYTAVIIFLTIYIPPLSNKVLNFIRNKV